jgi:predicted phage-related endonuclease
LTSTALQWLFPRDNGLTVDLSESAEFNTLFTSLLAERQRKDDAEAREALIRQQIQNALGSATAALFQSGRVTWKKSKDRIAPDIDRLNAEHPTLLQQYTKPVPGSRRFVVQLDRRPS